MAAMREISGGVTAARGFRATGFKAGLKADRADLAIVASDHPCALAAVFTTNRIQGATVKVDRERLDAGGPARGVVINSGNANACTGPQGLADAREMARLLAEALGVEERQALVCSTGTIGIPLPMAKLRAAIPAAVAGLRPDGGEDASRAIMTTDTVNKQFAVELAVGGTTVRVGGMAKGAGMIEPHMATMLAFLTTDADVAPAALQACLRAAVGRTFNCISVDGDQSCNDTILLFANGAAGGARLDERHADWPQFAATVERVCHELATRIVKDGEGATKFVTVDVRGAVSDAEAERAARAISRSLLVKTSWFGCDPNWGRVIDAVGYSGATVVEERVEIAYDGLAAFQAGKPLLHARLKELEAILRQPAFTLSVDLGLGSGRARLYTCDCSLDYVKINAEYMT